MSASQLEVRQSERAPIIKARVRARRQGLEVGTALERRKAALTRPLERGYELTVDRRPVLRHVSHEEAEPVNSLLDNGYISVGGLSMELTPAQRSLRARAAAHSSWARTADRTERTQPGRDAFLRRFEDQVDPERKLPHDERLHRAEQARKAHFVQLALRSSRARQLASRNGASPPPPSGTLSD